MRFGIGVPLVASHSSGLPCTLYEALLIGGADLFNALFRLCVKLRSEPGGCDARWCPNARGARRVSKRHQYNEHVLASAEAMQENACYRTRAGRLDKWKELGRTAREQLQLPPENPESLKYLDSISSSWGLSCVCVCVFMFMSRSALPLLFAHLCVIFAECWTSFSSGCLADSSRLLSCSAYLSTSWRDIS